MKNIKHINKLIFFTLCYFIITLFISNNSTLYAQNSAPYLVPRQIYVGDPAALILPLPASTQNMEDAVLTKTDSLTGNAFPSDDDIDFHRIILERRITGSRLVIEFTAFAPGVLEFPEIEIDGEYFSGLSITVNTLINDRSDRVLSGSASTLAMPGTALLLYGSMAVLAFIILLTIWFFVKGRTVLRALYEKWKRYKLFSGIRRTEKNLQKAVLKGIDRRLILDELSRESRNFLSILTDKNCRAMTAREFDTLPPEVFMHTAVAVHAASADSPADDDYLQITLIGKFFKSCDDLRFSGIICGSEEITRLLADLLRMVDMLEKIKGRRNQSSAAEKKE